MVLFVILLCLVTNFIYGQDNKSNEEISAKFDKKYKKLFLTPKNNPELAQNLKTLLLNGKNYALYQISNDNPGTNIQRDLDKVLEKERPFECSSAKADRSDCQSMSVDFNFCKNGEVNDSCISSGYYIIQITGLKTLTNNRSDSLIFEVDVSETASPPKTTIEAAIDGSRDRIRIKSDSVITLQPTLDLKNEKYAISKDKKTIVSSPENQKAKVIDLQTGKEADGTRSGDDFTLALDNSLSKARTHKLSIEDGITDSQQGKVKGTKGAITIQGLPPSPSSLNLETVLSFEGASGAKPIYDIDLKYNAQNLIPIRDCRLTLFVENPCFFQPKIEIDLGLGGSKSDNTIIVDLPFRTTIKAGRKTSYGFTDKVFEGTDYKSRLPNYYGWTQTPLYKGEIYFFAGPKFESDRKFKRINLLGSLQLDFRSYRLLGSIKEQRDLLTGATYGVEKEKTDLVEIKTGNTFIPFVGIDFGRKVKNETVEIDNTNISETIPKYNIFRVYTGFSNTLETQLFRFPVNLTFEEKLFYLATEERIGSVVKGAIDIRKVEGFQHRGSVSFDFFFNQIRRYSFNITYVNGRKAPNFEYLNKVTAGFKIRY